MNQENKQPAEDAGELYKAGREAVTGPDAKPEDLVAFDEAYSDTVDNLTKKYGEQEALSIMHQFLLDSTKKVEGKLQELLEANKI